MFFKVKRFFKKEYNKFICIEKRMKYSRIACIQRFCNSNEWIV